MEQWLLKDTQCPDHVPILCSLHRVWSIDAETEDKGPSPRGLHAPWVNGACGMNRVC